MDDHKKKNIILCADGTGNRGGYTPDSNVYKIYNAIELHDDNLEQLTFYDNGVGTQTNKYLRGIAGAFGFGFKSNVCDLYEFLARNYHPGDDIYMFGFSRGAATIRAFNGFIHSVGLVNGQGEGNKELKHFVDLAMEAYVHPKKRDDIRAKLRMHEHMPKIKFIGVWDTVSALGFPERKDLVGVILWFFHKVFQVLSWLINKVDPYNFYDYELTPNIIRARHALAIDDERTSFWPMVWDESTEASQNVDVQQVWFSGMHSNVGGGYERPELANVAYYWMLENIDGLIFKKGFLESARADANVNGRLYNSRQGFATFYRYHPRELKALCQAANTEVKIHESAMDRLKRRTSNYAPTSFPPSFKIVDNQNNAQANTPVYMEHWKIFRKKIEKWIMTRKWLYAAFIEISLVFAALTIYFWNKGYKISDYEVTGLKGHLVDILEYFTPEMMEGLIVVGVILYPISGLIAVGALIIFFMFTRYAQKRTLIFAEALRSLYINDSKGHRDCV